MADPLAASCGRILIVDDSLLDRRLAAHICRRAGYTVYESSNGSEALALAARLAPDLVLLDIAMPDLSGYEVCTQLKQEPDTAGIPIIFISALSDSSDTVRAFEAGGVDYVPKPFRAPEVLARIRHHLALHSLQRELTRANDELEQRVRLRTAELERLNQELYELNAAYERFVPRTFLNFLQRSNITEVKLGDQVQRDLTLLCADIRAFTQRAERMSPQQSFDFLNEYLRRVGPVVRRFAGMVDQYIGDGIMALFPRSVDDALHTAMELQAEIARFSAALVAAGEPPVALGIGLHTGRVILGVIGEEERMQGTVISDAVNIAAHLERLTKVYGARILATLPAVQQLSSRAHCRRRTLAVVRVKQRSEPVTVVEFFDADPLPLADLKEATLSDFEQGLASFNAHDFSAAAGRFQSVLTASPEDAAARLYLNRATYLLANPAPPPFIMAEGF